jgi:uncharacterized membrane protein YidH (DUF202 family)
VTAPARWPCHYCLRRPRREPRSWLLVAIVLVVVVGVAVVAIIGLGADALR